MNITYYDLDNLITHCDALSKVCRDIKISSNPPRDERHIFKSAKDYNDSSLARFECPQDFYTLHIFDKFVQLVFNKRLKKYQIYLDGFYTPILNKYTHDQRHTKSFVISENFDESLEVWRQVSQEILNTLIPQMDLF